MKNTVIVAAAAATMLFVFMPSIFAAAFVFDLTRLFEGRVNVARFAQPPPGVARELKDSLILRIPLPSEGNRRIG